MHLSDWTRQLTDEYLINWTSKGLFRRAGKLADQSPDISSANPALPLTLRIDHVDVTLSGTDLAQFTCQCGTLGSCVHQLAFLLKLRQLNATDTTVSAAPFEAERWCIRSREALDQAYGRGNATQAIKLYQKGALVTFETQPNHCVVQVTLHSQKTYQLHFPATGEWASVLCNCQETPCTHRALAILAFSVAHNTFSAEADIELDRLNPEQAELVNTVQAWLQTLLKTGTTETLKAQIDQGAGYSTELNQADLPKPAALLGGLISTLRLLQQKHYQASHSRLLEQIADVLLNLNALSQPLLPQPLRELAGQHRRLYRPQSSMTLIGLNAVFWQDEQRGRGFRYYCYDPQSAEFYTVAASRKAGLDPSWSPQQGFHECRLVMHPLSAAQFREFEFAGAISEDGSINAAQTRHVHLLRPVTFAMLRALPALSIQPQWQKLAGKLAAPTAPAHRDYLGWVVTQSRRPLHAEPALGEWQASCQSLCGHDIRVRVPADTMSADLQQRWNAATDAVLFGRWQTGQGHPTFQCITLLDDTLMQQHHQNGHSHD